MFTSYDPTLYGATLPQRDSSFVNPYSAPWSPPLPMASYAPQMPYPAYASQMPYPAYAPQMPYPAYGQQMPYPAYGQQIPWSFYPRVAPQFAQPEFAPPTLPFQGPIQGRNFNYFGQVPYLPYPQSNFNVPQFKTQLPFGY